jgi:hypothetical protein
MNFPNPHEHSDRIGLAFDLAVAAKIRKDSSAVDIAKRNLAQWRAQAGGILAPAHQEWDRILRFLNPDQLAEFLVSRTPMAARLSQSSPFAGVLTEDERKAILQEYAALAT